MIFLSGLVERSNDRRKKVEQPTQSINLVPILIHYTRKIYSKIHYITIGESDGGLEIEKKEKKK